MTDIKYIQPPHRRLLLLALTFIAGLCLTGVLSYLIGSIAGPARMLPAMRIATVVQDVVMLVLPAVVTAMMVTRTPARLLGIQSSPSPLAYFLAIAALLFASPFMSVIIEWNASLHFPRSMSALEQALRLMEQNAEAGVNLILGPHTPANLVMSLLLVAVLAGFSEELFFRGTMQRILCGTAMSPAVAVWLTACVFSAVHFQVFGFVPRMILGAYFGYLMLWSGSVWLPMAVHVTNNALFVILRYTTGSGEPQFSHDQYSSLLVTASLILTAGAIAALHFILRNQKSK